MEDIFDSTAGNNQQEDLDLVQRSADQSAQLEQLIQDKSNYEENNNLSGSKEQFPVQINENEVNGIYTGDDLGEDKTPSYGKGKVNQTNHWLTFISIFRWLRPNNKNLEELKSKDKLEQRNKRSDDGLLSLVDYKTSLLINTMSSQSKDSGYLE